MAKDKSKDPKGAKPETDTSPIHKNPTSPLGVLREWVDALVIAFLLAMFIRTFVVELFKIPSGSMTPTLIGTSVNAAGFPEEVVIEWDVDGDGEKDLILDRGFRGHSRYHVFYHKNGEFTSESEEFANLDIPIEARRAGRRRNDRIVVNKFIYWFREPRRGEIVVFRVPPAIYERDKPIFIKRVVGRPGETVEIREPELWVDGRRVTDPPVFERIEYVNEFQGATSVDGPPYRPGYIDWKVVGTGFGMMDYFNRAEVPEDHYLVFGDNSRSSRDSRDWGAVSERQIKGMAVLRYWPLDTFGFLE